MSNLLESISRSLMVSERPLRYLIRSSPYRYKVFEIEKRQGNGKRIIAQPAREVKALQRWAVDNILRKYKVHPAAMAYRKGHSILTNATVHAGRRFLLKMDFKDFFHSINAQDFANFVCKTSPGSYTVEEVELLCKILFWDKERRGKLVLSIGAPSSPTLSNVLLYDFDKAVRLYCAPRKIKYSRYADDLTFSTNLPGILGNVPQKIASICDEMDSPKLLINHSKTVHASKKFSRRVTGLVLTNEGGVSIGREKKRKLRAMVHRYLNGRLSVDETEALKGMIAFVRSAEPKFIDSLKRFYGANEMRSILG